MDEYGGPSNIPVTFRPQETFQRVQEAQVEHRFPNPTGIVSLPRGSRGPRSLYLRRYGDSFGFTLRHFIVYPPESIAEYHDGRHAAVGALLAPMDTIFVKHVKDRSSAKLAGLQKGDRLVAVNGIPVKDKTYSQVVQLIVNSPEYLHLLVVPKEEDVLQRFFAETAHNPVSNQQIYPETPVDKHTAQQIISKRLAHVPPEFQVDAFSWRTLQQPYGIIGEPLQRVEYERGQHSAESLLQNVPRRNNQQEIYAEIQPHDTDKIRRSKAAPQVPLYKKMDRRASEGNILSNPERYNTEYSSLIPMSENKYNMTTIYKSSNYMSETPDFSSKTPNCRHSMEVERRRESTSSLSSSIPESTKDSLISFDSNSTLTGHETDDSAIMNRFRKSVQQKEEFLKTPVNVTDQSIVRKEFYSRPKKLERQVWPPNERESKNSKPSHQNFIRVKNDIENERDLSGGNPQNGYPVQGGAINNVPQQRGVTSPKEKILVNADRIYEASIPPSEFDSTEGLNGSAAEDAYIDDRRVYSPPLQIVSKRAKDFESGKPLPEDDPIQANKTNFSRSELARLSSKKLVPNVTELAQDYEIKASEPKKDTSLTSTTSSNSVLKRIQRDSRSLDSSGSNASSASVHEILFGGGSGKGLSGNVTISSGSKYLHCPLPSEFQSGKPPADIVDLTPKMRVRSNSVESWIGAMTDRRKAKDESQKTRDCEVTLDLSRSPSNPPCTDLPPLIPESVERIHLAPSVSITPPTPMNKPIRPTQLDLDGPVKSAWLLKPPSTHPDASQRRSLTPHFDDKPVVVKRRNKSTNMADDERATRRESYLKATEGGRMYIDSDLSDSGELSPQALRSGSISSSNASLDRDKVSEGSSPLVESKELSFIVKDGVLHCKILEIDGKRATDRSWKQVFVVLKGPKLFLYRDRHHQSPVGTSDSLDQSLSTGVDMRTSVVRVAEDYTKRKNVLRVSAVKPCRSEFLLQADSSDEFADWVKILQEQVAASTDAELEQQCSKQKAVPQLVPASTTIQVQGSYLSPQLNKQKPTTSRNRSPTGQSPVSKSRKSSQIPEPGATSPKSKTWRGRMVKQFKKFNQGGNSPSSPTAPEGSTFGIPIEHCIPSDNNHYLPRFVEVCTDIIDERGLQTIGIYRVPGNNASITALTDEINRNHEEVPLEDHRWNDLHVVSSLLKSYFRKMPDSLITVQRYQSFIKADKIENPKERMEQLRRLIKSLPKHNYYTLKHMVMHLRRVGNNSNVNKMDFKNLAIVFGPTIVRAEEENMESMVSHMNNQYKIVETLLTHADWFFPENETEENLPVPDSLVDVNEEFDNNNQSLLLNNIGKYGALKDQKEKNGALFYSIISAAQQKIKRKPHKPMNLMQESKEEPASPTNLKVFPTQSFSPIDLKDSSLPDEKSPEIPTTVTDIEKKSATEKVPWFKYESDKDEFHRRIENFKQETEAMLQLPRKTEISVSNIDPRSIGQNSSTTSNNRLNIPKQSDVHHLMKTNSATNVFSRTNNPAEVNRNSLASIDNFAVQYTNNKNGNEYNYVKQRDVKNATKNLSGGDDTDGGFSDRTISNFRGNIRRGGSVENVSSNSVDLVSNGKKIKYESENESGRIATGSLESLNKLANDDESLLSTMTKLIDERLKEEPSVLSGDGIPFVDESPEKHPKNFYLDKENIPQASDLYRNPSLHKNQLKMSKKEDKEYKNDKEKEEDTMAMEKVPDNDRNITKTLMFSNNNKFNQNGTKLRRSESLNKPERTVSPLNNKLKRSESLNKAGDRLKRSDSLSKSEKTESNINRKREITLSNRRFKDSNKNKRKNGMPDRSIKRRHTVGGTKDPDKITWVMDNKNQEVGANQVPRKEKNLRTSSPDLSTMRRDRVCFEINFIGPENMVVAVSQHLIEARPQSFPESSMFKVPLESHV
ncbi:rho GTPase-activating protein 21-A isoform X4 [Diorhabda sublineata]|uniref:rho GTPase-activating protein 21-A isoform X4 n=1 Tax=Diorhabda sublineata TaxID=1163346 RepID=UPI0024E0D330|nr:rho GTPase-activating protein 21-A isoform X4 [Diorhabda sublineata]